MIRDDHEGDRSLRSRSSEGVEHTLRPNPWFTAVLAVLGVVVALLGVAPILSGGPWWVLVAAWSLLVGGALMLALVPLRLIPALLNVELSEEGITVSRLGRSHKVRWEDVQEFGVLRTGPTGMVAFRLKPGHGDDERGARRAEARTGWHGGLPHGVGAGPEKVASLLEEWRTRYTHQE